VCVCARVCKCATISVRVRGIEREREREGGRLHGFCCARAMRTFLGRLCVAAGARVLGMRHVYCSLCRSRSLSVFSDFFFHFLRLREGSFYTHTHTRARFTQEGCYCRRLRPFYWYGPTTTTTTTTTTIIHYTLYTTYSGCKLFKR